MRRFLQDWVPRRARVVLRRVVVFPLDALSALGSRRDHLVPPRGLISVQGDYEAIGQEFVGYLVDLCHLTPADSVLDIGCGIGRMAVPLTRYLSSQGRYEGFDIIRDGIRWCSREITPRFPNFRFQHVDVHNSNYNPGGRLAAEEFQFPYPDCSFDVAFAASVFTHMLPAATTAYLREIARVLKPKGRCLLTFFIAGAAVDPAAETFTTAFPYRLGTHWVRDLRKPEIAVCHEEDFALTALHEARLQLVPPIRYGSWTGHADSLSFQDIVIASRQETALGPEQVPGTHVAELSEGCARGTQTPRRLDQLDRRLARSLVR